MERELAQKTAGILIVDSLASRSQAIQETLAGLGYEKISSVKTGKEALSVLETDEVNWIIAGFNGKEEVNLLQILKLITQNPILCSTRVSLFLAKDDSYCLSLAFELGLLSFHVDIEDSEKIAAEIKKILELYANNGWCSTKVAASYLREYLISQGQFKTLLHFEKDMMKFNPGDVSQLISLAEAQFLGGDNDSGEITLNQAVFIDASLKAVADHIRNKYSLNMNSDSELQNQMEPISQTEMLPNPLGLKTCVIVDSDTSVLYSIENFLKGAGIPFIHQFEDGAKAWEWIKENPEPDIIIIEWKIPEVTGPMLLQRIRSIGYLNVPIVIISSLLHKEDVSLLKEMGASDVITKPFDQQIFFSSIIWTLQQENNPTELRALVGQIHASLEQKNFAEASRLKLKLLWHEEITDAVVLWTDAEFAYYEGEYEKCRDLALKAIDAAPNILPIHNLLGKCCLKLHQFDLALQAFEHSLKFSPENLQRLCDLAEVHQQKGDKEKADETLKKAVTIDPDNPHVIEKQIEYSIVDGNTDLARELFKKIDSIGRLLGYMNNRAVALALAQKFDEGIELYRKTITSIPEDKIAMREMVQYNLGLAYARCNNLEEAKKALAEFSNCNNPALQKKIASLRSRIETAIKSGETLELKTASKTSPSSTAMDRDGGTAADENARVFEIKASMLLGQGDLCCHKLYLNPAMINELSLNLIKSVPH
ncbi:MAG: response regulator, partial [Oligoflexales bacterium]|nr:response regulator [Oligoflexales bacterium]